MFELLVGVGFNDPELKAKFNRFEEANDAAWALIGKDFGMNGRYTTSIRKNDETGEQRIVVSGDNRVMIYIIRGQ